jgi:hypothetical protein
MRHLAIGDIDNTASLKPARIVMLPGVDMFPDDVSVPVIFTHDAAARQLDTSGILRAFIDEQSTAWPHIAPARHPWSGAPAMCYLASLVDQIGILSPDGGN